MQDNNAVSFVFKTSDYDIFKKLSGNREILNQRKLLIISSIKERGWIRNPIIVNEKMEIIDGQGRFEALKELGMPIEYVISYGATIEDCVALNMKQANWKAIDFIKCYAELGYIDYQILLEMCEKYDLQEQIVILVSHAYDGDSGAKIKKGNIRNGSFRIMDKKSLEDRLEFVKKCIDIIKERNGGVGEIKKWAVVLKFVYFCPKINNDIFLKKLVTYQKFISPCATTKQVIDILEKIYNAKVAVNNRVYFAQERDKLPLIYKKLLENETP